MDQTDSDIPVSDYAKYLPPFLTSPEMHPTGFLGRFLCIFESLLTGRSDAPPASDIVSVEEKINRLPEFFEPWRTDDKFLPYLAARFGLRLEDHWDEYRRRRLVESIVGLYQQRWLKKGLYTFLDLYAATGAQPRVAIDDGESLLAGKWISDAGGDFLDLHPIAFARPQTKGSTGAALLHPTAIAVGGVAGRREYLVADAGPLDLAGGERRASLWRLSVDGQFLDWSDGDKKVPLPLKDPDPPPPPALNPHPPLQDPCAVLADNDGSYLVLDRVDPQSFDKAVVYRYRQGQVRQTAVSAANLQVNFPVDMVWDASHRLLILDVGKPDPATGAPRPRLVRVSLPGGDGAPPTAFPLAPEVLSPTALVLEASGTVLVADAREQNVPAPGGLVRVTLGPPLKKESLLTDLPPGANPLLAPNALLVRPDGAVIVCDLGLKTEATSEPLVRVAAEPVRLYSVDLTSTPSFQQIRLKTPLVTPVRLAWDESKLLLLDHGFFHKDNRDRKKEWRTQAHQFGVVVDFSKTRPSLPEDRREFLQTVMRLLDRERPAHVIWRFQFEPDPGTNTSPTPGLAFTAMPRPPSE